MPKSKCASARYVVVVGGIVVGCVEEFQICIVVLDVGVVDQMIWEFIMMNVVYVVKILDSDFNFVVTDGWCVLQPGFWHGIDKKSNT